MIKIVYVEARTVEEAVEATRQLTGAPAEDVSDDTPSPETPPDETPAKRLSGKRASAGPTGDTLLDLEELISADLVPMRRMPRTGKTVRSWIRAGKLPQPVKGFGLGAMWKRRQFLQQEAS